MSNAVRLDQHRAMRPQSISIKSAGAYDGAALQQREWVIPGILVRRGITLLNGGGGLGKSLLCLQAQVALALGREWIGIPPSNPISSFGFYCEDDWDEIHRRLHDILKHYNATFADLGDRVRFASRVGEKNELVSYNSRNEAGQTTVVFDQIMTEVDRWGTQLVIIDTVADTFAGNENARPQARHFVNTLRRFGFPNNGGVILTAHPSRAGLVDGTGMSGSTAWDGSVRSRIFLMKPNTPKDEAGDPMPTNDRIFQVMKTNYSQSGDRIYLRYSNGSFLKVNLQEAVQNAGKAQNALLEACRWLVNNNQNPTASWDHSAGLITKASSYPATKHLDRRQLINAQEQLIKRGELKYDKQGRTTYIIPAVLNPDYGEDDEHET